MSTKNSSTYCAAVCRHKPLLLSTWQGVLFLVQFNNFVGFYWGYMLLLKPTIFMCPCSHFIFIGIQFTFSLLNHTSINNLTSVWPFNYLQLWSRLFYCAFRPKPCPRLPVSLYHFQVNMYTCLILHFSLVSMVTSGSLFPRTYKKFS